EDLVANRRAGPRADRARRRFAARASAAGAGARPALREGRVVLAVGHPHVAVAIDVDAVREDQHAGGEALDEFSAGVEFHHSRHVHDLAGGAVETAVLAAALGD